MQRVVIEYVQRDARGYDRLRRHRPKRPHLNINKNRHHRPNKAGERAGRGVHDNSRNHRSIAEQSQQPSPHSVLETLALGRSPVIRPLLIIQVPNASNKRGVAPTFRPIDRLSLRFESGEHVIRMVFDDIIVDMAPLRAALGTRFNVNVRHAPLSLGRFCWRPKNYTKPKPPVALKLPFRHYLRNNYHHRTRGAGKCDQRQLGHNNRRDLYCPIKPRLTGPLSTIRDVHRVQYS